MPFVEPRDEKVRNRKEKGQTIHCLAQQFVGGLENLETGMNKGQGCPGHPMLLSAFGGTVHFLFLV
ncbi:MAG TPA: hypothetical protein DIC23_07385 [Planctomycetaceae bacterium]|nr:hypothetical protein [Planctomycetaceae bacterium]